MADGDKIKQVFWNFCENAVRAMGSGGVLRVSLEQIGERLADQLCRHRPRHEPPDGGEDFRAFPIAIRRWDRSGTGDRLSDRAGPRRQGVGALESREREACLFSACAALAVSRRRCSSQPAVAPILAAGSESRSRGRGRNRRPRAWVIFWFVTTSVPSAKCWTSPSAAMATKLKPSIPAKDAKRKLDGALYDVVVTDIKMPHTDGIEVLRHAHQVSPDSAVILITAVDDYEAAVAGGESRRSQRLHPQVSRPGGRNQACHQPLAGKDDAEPAEFCLQARRQRRGTHWTTSWA